MPVYHNNSIISKLSNKNERILQKRDYLDRIIFSDTDIVLGVGVNQANRDTVGNVVLTFNKAVNARATWQIGNNSKTIRTYNSATITKQLATNIDNNGAGNGANAEAFTNFIYIIDKSGITSLSITSTGTGVVTSSLSILSELPELTSITFGIASNPAFSILANIPLVRYLDMMINVANFSGLAILSNSNLVALALRGYNTTQPALLANLPASLYSLEITQMTEFVIDLKDYFTGNRISLNLSTVQSVKTINYTGGALFPSIIADTSLFRISYIIQILGGRLTGSSLSRFIVDFANQVTQVNLGNTVAKRMRFQGSTADTAYTDNTQPIYQTYTSALNFITRSVATGGLAISVQFS